MSYDPPEVLQHPDLSDAAKALFLMLLVNSGTETIRMLAEDVPENHWWTSRTTESMLDELVHCGVMGRS